MCILFNLIIIIITCKQLISDLDKAEFAKQVVELQEKVKEMEEVDRPTKDEVSQNLKKCMDTYVNISFLVN